MNPDTPTTPPAPNPTAATDTPEPAVTPITNPAPVPGKRRSLLLVLTAIIVVVAIAVFLFIRYADSGSAFDKALSNALETQNFTQYNTAGASHLTIKYDVADPRNPRVETEGKLVQGDTTTAFNGYGTFKDSYVKFTTFTTGGESVPQAALDKWFQVRKNGFDASGGYFSALFQNDPHSAFFGDLIFGNFSKNDRSKLMAYIRDHKVYTVDETKAQHGTYEGNPVIIYDMTENKDALTSFNKMAGQMVGLSGSQLNQDMENLHFPGAAKVYISEKTKRFVHIDVSSSSVDYTDYGTTKLGGAPTPQTTFEQFENLIVHQPSATSTI